jgi:hypothetical protein
VGVGEGKEDTSLTHPHPHAHTHTTPTPTQPSTHTHTLKLIKAKKLSKEQYKEIDNKYTPTRIMVNNPGRQDLKKNAF